MDREDPKLLERAPCRPTQLATVVSRPEPPLALIPSHPPVDSLSVSLTPSLFLFFFRSCPMEPWPHPASWTSPDLKPRRTYHQFLLSLMAYLSLLFACRSRHGHHRMQSSSSLVASPPFWPKIEPRRAPHPRSGTSPCSPLAPPCPWPPSKLCITPILLLLLLQMQRRTSTSTPRPFARAWASRRPRPSQRVSLGPGLAPSPSSSPAAASLASALPRLLLLDRVSKAFGV